MKNLQLKTFCIRQSCIWPISIRNRTSWLAWIILRTIQNKTINIFGNGKQVRDILYVSDLTELFYKLYRYKERKNIDGYFNCGGGIKNSLSIIELISILEKKLKRKIKYKFKSKRKSDQKIFISDNSKLKSLLNWYPNTDKNKGINLLFE